jgi:hypothetical protein
MRTVEKKRYYARCVDLGCHKTWSGKTQKQITRANAAARAHCQQSGHTIRAFTERNTIHRATGKRK